jgi:hypothetical protein
VYQKTTKLLCNTVFGTQEAKKKDMFGEYTLEAEKELNRFKRPEDYLQALIGAFQNLEQSVTSLISS